jgi:hypothetical protein
VPILNETVRGFKLLSNSRAKEQVKIVSLNIGTEGVVKIKRVSQCMKTLERIPCENSTLKGFSRGLIQPLVTSLTFAGELHHPSLVTLLYSQPVPL